jgi:hypothetical protein
MTRRRFLEAFSISLCRVRYSSRNEVVHNQVSVTVTAAQHAGTTSVLLCSAAPPVQLAGSMAGGRTAVHSERSEPSVIPALAGTKHGYDRPKG